MDTSLRKFFERYERSFNQALRADQDIDEAVNFYAAEFIAVSPAGVATGKNDEQLKRVMAEGYARYRAIGTKEMRLRNVRISPIDDLHCIAHVSWTAAYAREGQADVAIDFDVHYLVQNLGKEPKIFGWISADEQALLKKHGIV